MRRSLISCAQTLWQQRASRHATLYAKIENVTRCASVRFMASKASEKQDEHDGAKEIDDDNDAMQQMQPAKRSTKNFNLLDTTSSPTMPSGPRKHRPQYYEVHRPDDSNWWKSMDRTSFRKLLDECMATGRVSRPLRTYMAEFPLFETKWTDQELVLMVGALIRMGKEDTAIELLKKQMDDDVNINRLNRVMAESARLGNAQVALGAFDIAEHLELTPDVITYTSAIHACARGKREDIPTALELFNTMLERKVTPNHRTYGALVLAYARLAMWDEIQSLLQTIPYDDTVTKQDVMTAAIMTCTKNFQFPTASQLFRMLLDEGIFLGDKACNAAMSACARTRDLTSLQAFYRLQQRHGRPTLHTMNTMIAAYGNMSQVDEAFAIYDTMTKEHGMKPDIVTFNTLLTACMRSRRMELASQVLEDMKAMHMKWDDCTLNILLHGCAMIRDVDQAEAYWRMATEEFDLWIDRRHFEALMEVYFESGAFAKCLDLWKKSYKCRRRAMTAKSLNLLVQSCAQLKDDETAASLMNEFAQRGLVATAITHNHMLEALLNADKPDKAHQYIYKLVQQDGLATTFGFTQLIQYYLTQKRPDDALHMFVLYLQARSSRPKWVNPFLHYPTDALYVLAARAAMQSEADDAHDQLLSLYRSCPSTTSSVVKNELAKLVIDSCAKHQDWKNAVSLFDKITHTLDDDLNTELYEKVVQLVARAGEFEQALDVNNGAWYRRNRLDRGWKF